MNAAARAEITAALLEGRRLLGRSRNDMGALSESALVDLHENLERIVDTLGGLIPGATPPGRIEDFLAQVGESMVAAQAELDRQSFGYNAARPPGALPSAYRIPKVQAEIGFTMARKRARRFGIFALGRSASGEKGHSNSVSFEIIAVPPSPQMLEDLPLAARLITHPADRDGIKAALASALTETTVSTTVAKQMFQNFHSVLVLVHEQRWLLCHVLKEAKSGDKSAPARLAFGVLHQDPPRFVSHGPVSASQAGQGRWMQLTEFLGGLAEAQAAMLA